MINESIYYSLIYSVFIIFPVLCQCNTKFTLVGKQWVREEVWNVNWQVIKNMMMFV